MRATRLAAALLLLPLAAAKAPPVGPLLLDASVLDPALVLPPPPEPGSRAALADLEALRTADRTRAAADQAQAKEDGKVKDVSFFAPAIGFAPERLPAMVSLFATVRREEKAVADRAKEHFHRARPWIVDPALHPCSADDAPQTSYPSNHAISAFAMGAILARLMPARAEAVLSRAAVYANDRVVCEVHFPTDIAAGQALGLIIAERLMSIVSFRRQFDRVAAELEEQHLVAGSGGGAGLMGDQKGRREGFGGGQGRAW